MTAYRNMYRTARRGFTLVEILIVVIILGILAAIVIPQFTDASENARKTNMASQLQTLRSQIELFKLQHRDEAPPLATFWDFMTQYSQADVAEGTQTTKDVDFKFGPYMQQAVVNPLTGESALGDKAGGANLGWAYDATTGEIHGLKKDGTTLTDDGDATSPTPAGW